MAMKLDRVVPFGRSLDEYQRMFALSAADLQSRILGIADGPASFNSELTARGGRVVSVDPIYVFSGAQIEAQFHAVVDHIIAQVRATPDDWVWTYHASPDHLRARRVEVLHRFLADYAQGLAAGRYIPGELPGLPDVPALREPFDLALCSHFLFLYSAQLDAVFHRAAVRELLGRARELRIFPLLTLAGERSPHLDAVLKEAAELGVTASIERVDYELQRGGNEILRLRRDR